MQPISRSPPSVPSVLSVGILDAYAPKRLVALAVAKLMNEATAPLKAHAALTAASCVSLHHQAALRTRRRVKSAKTKTQHKLGYSFAKAALLSAQKSTRHIPASIRAQARRDRDVDFAALPFHREDSPYNEAVCHPAAATQIESEPLRVPQVTNTRTSLEYSVPSASHTISSASTNKAGNQTNNSTSMRIKRDTKSHEGK